MVTQYKGSPAASLRVPLLLPRLYSGLSNLLLSLVRIAAVAAQQKTALEQLQGSMGLPCYLPPAKLPPRRQYDWRQLVTV